MIELLLPVLLGISAASMLFTSSDSPNESDIDEEGDDNFFPEREDGGNILLEFGAQADDIFPSILPTDQDNSEFFDENIVKFEHDARGFAIGTERDDVIEVDVVSSTNAFDQWYGDSVETDFSIRGSDGSDTISLSGSGYSAFGDEGSDMILLGDASNVAVFAGAGDSVAGGTGSDVFISLSDNATFEGGEGAVHVQSSSSSEIRLGEGDDYYIGVGLDANQSVYGGEGNDYLIGSVVRPGVLWEVHEGDSNLVSFDRDTLFGGGGDDTIIGSHGDIMIGGDGSDSFTLVLEPRDYSEAASITDFVPGKDRLFIRCGSNPNGEDLRFDGFAQEVTSNGDTEVSTAGDRLLVTLEGVSEVCVGVMTWNNTTNSFETFNLDGNLVNQNSCDVLIMSRIEEFGI